MDNKKVGLKDLARKAKVDFIAMAERAWMTAREYKKIYGNDDLRGEFFLLFSEDIIWVVIQLENFYEGYPQHKVHSYFSKLQDSSKVQLVSQFDTINRQSFIALSMFNVDHFVTVLAECLKLKCTNNYKAVVESLSNELFFQTDPNKAKAVFEILYSP